MLIIDLFWAGGIVMIPLLVFSIVAIALIIERIVFWVRINRRQKRGVRDMLRAYPDNFNAALLKLKQNADLPIARIFLEALEVNHFPPHAFRLTLEGATQAELPMLRRFNTVFDTIVTLSPLLGLLGTVIGLIRSFASLNLGSVGGDSALQVTGGISEALVSTAAGLIVAVFTLLFANVFRGFYRRQISTIQEYGSQLEVLHLSQHEGFEGGISVLLLCLCLLFSVTLGAADIDVETVWRSFTAFDGSTSHLIITTVRLPRVLIALVVGVALGVAGSLMQGLTRNALADPGIVYSPVASLCAGAKHDEFRR